MLSHCIHVLDSFCLKVNENTHRERESEKKAIRIIRTMLFLK